MRNLPPKEQVQEALKWWRSLPGAKKRYLREHCKLQDNVKITRHWLATRSQA